MANDNGYKSRKLILVMFSTLLVTGVGLLTNKYQGLVTIYSTLCSTVVALTALYFGANSVAKHLDSKAEAKKSEET